MMRHSPAVGPLMCIACVAFISVLTVGYAMQQPQEPQQPAPSNLPADSPGNLLRDTATSRPATQPSAVVDWSEMRPQSTPTGERRQVLRSPTATLDELSVHITTLNPGQQAHAPHRHANEELILLKEGTLEAMINDRTFPMSAGSVLVIAPNDLHVVRNTGTTRATYFVTIWRTPRTGGGK